MHIYIYIYTVYISVHFKEPLIFVKWAWAFLGNLMLSIKIIAWQTEIIFIAIKLHPNILIDYNALAKLIWQWLVVKLQVQ